MDRGHSWTTSIEHMSWIGQNEANFVLHRYCRQKMRSTFDVRLLYYLPFSKYFQLCKHLELDPTFSKLHARKKMVRRTTGDGRALVVLGWVHSLCRGPWLSTYIQVKQLSLSVVRDTVSLFFSTQAWPFPQIMSFTPTFTFSFVAQKIICFGLKYYPLLIFPYAHSNLYIL